MNLREKRAFSIIDLLVTIFVIIIIMTICIPSISRMRELGRRSTCAAQLGEIGKAIELYRDGYHIMPWARRFSSKEYYSYTSYVTLYGLTPEEMMQRYLHNKAAYVKDVPISKSLECFIEKDKFKCPDDTGPNIPKECPEHRISHFEKLKKEFNGRTFFEFEETSYEYVPYWMLEEIFPEEFIEKYLRDGASQVVIMNDYEAFHSEPEIEFGMNKSNCSLNLLFIDGHVGNKRSYSRSN